jgi:hypothetical protein
MPGHYNMAAPLTRWKQVAAYGTARQCEKARAKNERMYQAIFVKDIKAEDNKMLHAAEPAHDQAGRCVSAESVNPPE